MAKKTTELTKERIGQYVWKRYIDNTSNYPPVDDGEALEVLERYYAKHPVNEDEECFYYGILCFEMAWQIEDEAQQYRLIKKAKDVLDIYRKLSGEEDWDVIEDRLEECRDFIEETEPPAEVKEVEEAGPEVIAPKVVDGMILVSAGKFLFGPDKEEKFLEGFYIDQDPVSNKEYRAFVEETDYRTPRVWDERPELAEDELPVTGISWMDALQFCKWAHKELPTAEQWEKAARGIDGRTYPWGEDEPTAELACFDANGVEPALRPLSGFEKNISQFGCRYTVGHVWEWTSTSYEGEARNRIIKGGSWVDPAKPQFLSSWAAMWADVKEKSEIIGFRCVRPVGVV